jgi:tRNA pseudouridine38-40 synthase
VIVAGAAALLLSTINHQPSTGAQRLKLTLAYDGAPFAGWQSQVGGNTVQDRVEAALAKVAKAEIALHGSGRTDAGVHALGQVAHFDAPVDSRMKPADWLRALNANLPPEIRILRAVRAAADFHARFSAQGKTYRYELWTAPALPPHLHRRAWHVAPTPDFARLREALEIFVGEHDFRAFAANRGGKPVEDTVRRISAIRAARSGPLWRITFEGSGFLYKMVRMLTGAAVRVAQGREDIATLRRLIAEPRSGRWSHVAPADGLTLVQVRY